MEGQAAHSPHQKTNLIKACCRREAAYSCNGLPPRGAQGLLKATGLLVQGPVGKPNTDTVYSQAPEHCWERENKPLSGPEKKSRESKHKNCKDHPPDVRLPFGNK